MITLIKNNGESIDITDDAVVNTSAWSSSEGFITVQYQDDRMGYFENIKEVITGGDKMTDSQITLNKLKEYKEYSDANPQGYKSIEDWLRDLDKPKDSLWDKWTDFADYWHGPNQTKQSLGLDHMLHFNKFKEMFADNLNGVKLIDLAIEAFKRRAEKEVWKMPDEQLIGMWHLETLEKIKQDATPKGE